MCRILKAKIFLAIFLAATYIGSISKLTIIA
jgi:hypothetical protein